MGINRNIVECKVLCEYINWNARRCINRNIVECKGKWNCVKLNWTRSINRNIVECKVNDVAEAMATVNQVLIETLWNVKGESTNGL